MAAKDITQKLILQASLEDGVSKQVRKAGANSKRAMSVIERSINRVRKSFAKVTATVALFKRGLLALRTAIPGMAALGAVVAGGFGFAMATRAASEFSRAITEVSTLVDTSTVDMGRLREGVLEVSNAFGARNTIVAKGLYQVISSGAVGASRSIDLLRQSQALATAGVASTEQAVDVMTTALNAYGLAASEAERVSDVLFTTVKQGKTTLPELANGLGRAIPLAATLGVEIEELTAAIAAMTKAGIATDEAIVSMRGAFSALIKPSSEAVAILKEYKIDISRGRIASEGFVGVLSEIQAKMGDNSRAIAGVFPNVRALTGIFALTGNQFEEFKRILDENKEALGATGEALRKQLEDPAFRAIRSMEALRNSMLGMGEAVIAAFNDVIERAGGIERVTRNVSAAGKVVGAVFGAVAVNIGTALKKLDDFVESIGGAEHVSKLLSKSILLLGEVLAIGLDIAADKVSATIHLIARDFLDLRGLIDSLIPGEVFAPLASSGVVARIRAEELTDSIRQLKEEQAKYADDAGKTEAVLISQYGQTRRATEGAERYAEVTSLLALRQAELSFVTLQAATGIGTSGKQVDETADKYARLNELIGELNSTWEDFGKGPDTRGGGGETFWIIAQEFADSYFGGIAALTKDAAKDAEELGRVIADTNGEAFRFSTSEAQDFFDSLELRIAQMRGDKIALLDAEIKSMLASLEGEGGLTGLPSERAKIEELIKLYERLAKKRIGREAHEKAKRAARERAEAEKRFVEGIVSTYQGWIDASRRLKEEQRQTFEQAKDVLLQLSAANARSFDERIHFERMLLEAERDRTLAQFEGVENLEKISQRIRAAYDVQLEGLDASNLTGFTGMAEGAQDALEEFVVFAQDDAAWAFDSLSAALSGFSRGFGNAFVDFAMGTKSASEAFTSFASSFLADVARMMAQRASVQLLGAAFSGFFGVGDPRPPGVQGPLQSDGSFGKGGTIKGGISSLSKAIGYASGGPIVKRPHVALIGEGHMNEAVVPLPDGKSIPVAPAPGSGGGMGGSSNAYITVAPSIVIEVTSLDPRGVAEVITQPEVQKKLRASIGDALASGSDAAFSGAVRGA